MQHEYNKELALYRLEKAKEMMDSAQRELEAECYSTANNRAYYAIFHAMRASLAIKEMDFKKHSGVISHFKLFYIKTEVFDVKYSKIIDDASTIRNHSDYDDFYLCSKEETVRLLLNADAFVKDVTAWLEAQ